MIKKHLRGGIVLITIGMLGKKKKATKLKLAMASIAKLKDIQFYFFTPSDVDYDNKKISGKFYNGDKWEEKQFNYPDYIFDRMLFRGRKKYKKLYDEFSHIAFNNERKKGGSISKTYMYEIIANSKEFKSYLIPYIEVKNTEDVRRQLKKYGKIVCKADGGSLGLNVYFIEKKNEKYELKIHKNIYEYTEDKFTDFINENFVDSEETFVVQPYIQSKTNDGNPFDLRAHLMKDGNGKWSIVKIYPRIGARNSIISNLHLGGSTCDLKTFLTRHITVKDDKQFKKDVSTFTLEFANFIEQKLDYHFSELGLDIAVDENNKLWLFEVNMNRINVENLTFEAANHAISYGKYVVKNSFNK